MIVKKFTDIQAERAIRGAKATLAVEGMYPTIEQEKLVKQQLTGKISEAQFKKMALEMATGVKV
ncbi:hypothetical protein [Paenibacillus campi]|uniref:hypothetical protein n=1 Tax=Paenibacillus campi TaxID=3106031 RepID=UPI002AFF5C13|nr:MULTISPECIES: hypothetical protein [unclassified Paenibacillus]